MSTSSSQKPVATTNSSSGACRQLPPYMQGKSMWNQGWLKIWLEIEKPNNIVMHLKPDFLVGQSPKILWSAENENRETDWEWKRGEDGECGWTWSCPGRVNSALQVRWDKVCTVPQCDMTLPAACSINTTSVTVIEWNQWACYDNFNYARLKPFSVPAIYYGGHAMSRVWVNHHFSV